MPEKKKRGFAAMTPERRKEVASRGGKAAQKKGKAHKFTTAEAKIAGRKGGLASQAGGKGHRFKNQKQKDSE